MAEEPEQGSTGGGGGWWERSPAISHGGRSGGEAQVKWWGRGEEAGGIKIEGKSVFGIERRSAGSGSSLIERGEEEIGHV